jgi:hypothetical protein
MTKKEKVFQDQKVIHDITTLWNLLREELPGTTELRKVTIVSNIEGSEGAETAMCHLGGFAELDISIPTLLKGWQTVVSFLAHEITHTSLGQMVWSADSAQTSGGLVDDMDEIEPVFSRSFEEKLEERACLITERVALIMLQKVGMFQCVGEQLDKDVEKVYN